MGLIRVGIALVLVAMLAGAGGSRVGAQTATAEDGRTLAGETLETQTRFRAVWGDRAFAEWVLEHNAELHRSPGRTATPTTTPAATPTPPPGTTAAAPTVTLEAGMLSVVAGWGPPAEPRDELQLKPLGTPLMLLSEIASTPDGSIYLGGRLGAVAVLGLPYFVNGNGILRIDPAGFVHTVVGPSLNRGDGGPANDALLTPSAVASDPRYGLIIADKTQGVRHIDAGGTIHGLVPSAPIGQCERRRTPVLCSASDVVVGPDGTLFIADSLGQAVYRLARDRRLELVANEPLQPTHLALGPDGSLYVALPNKVVRLSPESDWTSRTVAGSGDRPQVGVGDLAGDGGPAVEARIGTIAALTVVPDGTLYLVDDTLHRVRRVGSDGIIREFSIEGAPNPNMVRTIARGPDGALYVGFNTEVDRMSADGSVMRVATPPQLAPPRDPAYYNEYDGVAFITHIALAADGTLFAVDSGRGRIQRITRDGAADHIAGAPAALQPGMSPVNRRPYRIDHLLGAIDGSIYFRADNRAWRLAPDGTLSELISPATFPLGVAQDGSLYYISDNREPGLRRRAADGTTRVIPGFDTVFTGGTAPVKLGAMGMLAFGEDGSVYSADIVDKQVWRVKPDGTPSVVYRGELTYIAVGPHNRLFVSVIGIGSSDWSRVDAVDVDGSVTPFAGTGVKGDGGDGGPAISALLDIPGGLLPGADGSLLIVDRGNDRVRRVAPDGTINTLAGLESAGADGQFVVNAGLRRPSGLAVARDGSVLIADAENFRVRRIGADGSVSTIAGTGSSRVPFEQPTRQPARATPIRVGDVALATDGSVYVASDKSFFREPKVVYHVVGADLVREQAPIDVAGLAMSATEQLVAVGNNAVARRASDGTWTTIAGQAHPGYNGDEMLAVNAALNTPLGVAVGTDGSVYIADTGNNRVRRITPDGRIHTLAGTGEGGYSGDGGPATIAELNAPSAVAVASDRTVFVADSRNHRVRRVKPDGQIDTVAGTGLGGDGPERGLAIQVVLNAPMGLALGPDGSLYISDTGNNRVRRLWGAVLHP